MLHFVAIKKQIHKDILAAVHEKGQLDYKKTIAGFSLNTGFTEKTITEIVRQMSELSYIKIENGNIVRPDSNG